MGIKEELKRDLVDPIKRFSDEVRSDTIGDAGRFYTAQARELRRRVRLAEARTKEKTEAIRREQAEMKKKRTAMLKRAALLFAAIAVLLLVIVSLALNRGL